MKKFLTATMFAVLALATAAPAMAGVGYDGRNWRHGSPGYHHPGWRGYHRGWRDRPGFSHRVRVCRPVTRCRRNCYTRRACYPVRRCRVVRTCRPRRMCHRVETYGYWGTRVVTRCYNTPACRVRRICRTVPRCRIVSSCRPACYTTRRCHWKMVYRYPM